MSRGRPRSSCASGPRRCVNVFRMSQRFFPIVMVVLATFSAVAVPAQPTSPAATDAPEIAKATAFPRGEVIERVVTLADEGQQYALFLPEGYDPARKWPVVFVLDPRGRAQTALGLFLAGIREHGWIALSSYQSRSDTDPAITGLAFEALLRDADARFEIDHQRFYIAGMSGTAFAAWRYGFIIPDQVAGVIGVGAGLPREQDSVGDVPYAYYGIAGWDDFNFQQQVLTDRLLDATEVPHRLALFDGIHGWSPEPFTRAAVDWMELIAMKEGLRTTDDAFVDRSLEVARARVEEATDPLTRVRHLRELVRDFDGLREIPAERERLATLEKDKAVTKAMALADKLASQEEAYRGRHARWYGAVRATGSPPTVQRSLVDLQIRRLQKLAADSSDPLTMHSARRRIEGAYTQLAFYLPEMLEAQNQPDWATAVIEIALEIKPDFPPIWWRYAATLARSGRAKKSLEALEKAVSFGHVDVERLRTDETWVPLRSLEGWSAILEAAGG